MSLRGKAQKKSKKGPPMTWKTSPPKISGTAGRMTIKFLPDVKYHREKRNPKDFFTLLIWSVIYGSAKSKNAQIACFLEMQLIDMLASQNFAGLLILTSKLILKISNRYLKD